MRHPDARRQEGRRAASHYLQQLLLKPGAYRQSWERYVSRERRGTINQLAVAEVIARHLWSVPRSSADAEITPHQLKDTVSRALTGRLLSRSALSLFIESFGFSEHEAGRLWRLWNGSATIGVMSGSHAVPVQAQRELAEMLGPARHQTLSLHDHVYIGEDGRIDRVRMLQVIEAVAQEVDRIPFLCDTNVLTVEVGQGGKELSGRVEQIQVNRVAGQGLHGQRGDEFAAATGHDHAHFGALIDQAAHKVGALVGSDTAADAQNDAFPIQPLHRSAFHFVGDMRGETPSPG